MIKPRQSSQPVRRLVLLAFTALIVWNAYQHHVSTGPSTDALCPFGAVETVWTYATTGKLVNKTHPSNLILGVGLGLGAVIGGAAFCGWICPFGALQDLVADARRRLRLPELYLPGWIDRILRWGRLLLLIGVPAMSVYTGTLWFADLDPYRTIFNLEWLLNFAPGEHLLAYTIAGLVVGGSFLISRFWCRYLCPQGLLLEWIGHISILRVWRNSATCINCRRCDQVCPSRLAVSTSLNANHAGHCIGCLECVDVCPVPRTLTVGTGPAKEARIGAEQVAS